MTIQVRVLSAAAIAQLRALEAQQRKTAMATRSIGQGAQWGLPFLSKWGNQVQWAGRQLIYNFTLPIALAGAAATKWGLENEKAMVRVIKVYGDGSKQFKQLSKTEIPALSHAFEALSNQFGVQQKLVIGIAGDWAAAGASGIALAKSVKLTLETMVLGEIDAAEATRNLISIQAQYGQSVTQLANTIDILNMVENQTGASMKDLMQGMERSAGVARVAGIDVRHLAAMIAALTPASGSAASAGNALKTIISRLLSPTKEATSLLKEMGIQVDGLSWNSLTGTQRIEELSKQFLNLSDAQKVHMATVLGSRWQLNRLIILMQAVNNENSYYAKSLKSTSDAQKVFRQRVFELNKVLNSSPQMMKQAWVILQNALTRVIIPMIPYIVYLAQEVARLATKFGEMDPVLQKMILGFLIFLAAIGPVARYVGSVTNLVGLLSAAVHFLGKSMIWAVKTPFKVFAAGLSGIASLLMIIPNMLIGFGGSVISAFSVLFGGGALLKPWAALWAGMVAITTKGVKWVLLSTTGLFAPMLAAVRGFSAPFKAAWTFLMLELTVAWAWMQRTIAAAWVGFTSVMKAALFSFSAGMTAGWAAMSTAITIAWAATQRTLVAITLAAQAAMTASLVAGRAAWGAFVTGVGGMITTLGLMFRRIPMLLMVNLVKIPALILALAGAVGSAIMAVLTSPWTLAIAAVLGLAYGFRDKIADIWNKVVGTVRDASEAFPAFFGPVGAFFDRLIGHIVDAFWALPQGIRNAMLATLNFIKNVALQIYEWMSYINPFVRHSPSLVESVNAGMDQIVKSYQKVAAIGSIFAAANKHLAQFKKMSGGTAQFADDRKNTKKSQRPLFDSMIADLNKLYPILRRQESALNAQQAVTDKWKNKLDDAKDHLDALTDAFNKHKDALDAFANAPIKGMKAMSDEIFANEMAQKKLRLEMLKWEQVNGTIDDMRNRLGLLQGDIETLRGKANELRMAGAGSDILGPIEDQIKAIEAQAAAVQNTVNNSPISEMQKQLDALQQQGEILSLTQSINFDPLIKQIDDLANGQKELSFDEIIAGINKQKDAMAALQPQIDSATASYDAIQQRYDKEKDALDAINDRYQKTKDLVNELESALNSMGSAAGSAGSKLAGAGGKGKGSSTFASAAGGNWADPGSFDKIGREGGMGDQSKMIEQFAQDSADQMGKIFGSFDMFAPLKKWWSRTWDWLKENVGPVVGDLGDAIGGAVGSVVGGLQSINWSPFINTFKDVWNTVADIVRTAWGWIQDIIALFAPDAKRIFDALVDAGKRVWTKIGPELAKFGKLWGPIGDALQRLWSLLKPILAILGGALLIAIKILASVISSTLGPVLNFIVDMVAAVIRVLRGIIEFVVGVFTGNWKLAWQGIVDIFGGIWDGIVGILKGVWGTIVGIVTGIFHGIVEAAKWLYDVLIGHSIIPDIVDGIINVFKRLWKMGQWWWDHILAPIFRAVKALWNDFVRPALSAWWTGIKTVWNILTTLGLWVWNNVLLPVFRRVGNLWDNVKGELDKWWTRITNVWGKLKELGKWFKDNVMDPVFDRITGGWERIKNWMENNKDILTGPAKGIINTVIKAVNKIIGGLNKISDTLPGLDFHIGAIPELAKGGRIPNRRVGSGFMTSGARAIVGEGKAAWPEFVIPTDPTHRNRARSLMSMAATRLGIGIVGDNKQSLERRVGQPLFNGVPAYSIGGILGDVIGDLGGKAWNAIKDLPVGKIASTLFQPFKAGANFMLNKADWNVPRELGKYGLNQVDDWLSALDGVLKTKGSKGGPAVQRALAFARSQVGASYQMGAVGPSSYDCSGFMSAITNVLNGKPPHQRLGATASFPWGGFVGGIDPRGFTIGSTKNYGGSGIGHMAGTLGGVNVESRGGTGVIVGAGARGWNDPGFTTVAHLRGLMHGAIVRARPGGHVVNVGEGRYDEAVVPLTPDFKSSMRGGSTITIQQLVLPNITSPEDAQDLLDNLENLGRG